MSAPPWRTPLLVFLAALAWFLPAIWWGLPAEGSLVPRPWGPDELAPWGVEAFLQTLGGREVGLSPQYPAFHYIVLGAVSWGSRLVLAALDNLGLPPQSASPGFLTLVERLPSAVLAALTVVAAWAAALRLSGDRGAALLAACASAAIGPLVYHARTSNVDAASLFWVAAALVPAAAALRSGLTVRRAALCGLCAGLGTATKDQQYAVFGALGAALLASHLADVRRAGARPDWRALGAGIAAGAAAWVLASGLVLLPAWFARHVDFILHGGNDDEPEAIRRLAGFYGSTPATLAGYAAVLARSVRQVHAAVGLPLLALAALGVVEAVRRDRRSLLLLLVPAGLFVGVILPVRFVLPRFLLPVDLVACLFAALAFAALRRTLSRRAATAVAVLALAWPLFRGLDLTWQMLRDTRYEAGAWLARHVQPGDTIGYYGARLKLPAIPRAAALTPAPFRVRPTGDTAADTRPAFIVTAPQQMHERDTEWALPDSAFRGLLDGSFGYQQVLAIQTRGAITRPLYVASFVNPPVRIFARRDVAARLADPPRIELRDPAARPR